MLDGKRILLIIGGGIAAYKVLDLIRKFADEGVTVRAILTKSGAEFVTPLSVSSLTGEKVFSDLFSLTDEAEMGHIRLSREADLVLVAPATADLMAKMAGGHASDLASTALMATDKPVMICPAMNTRMWENPATQRNAEQLARDGVTLVGPASGDLACGEVGAGRLTEPVDILAAVRRFFDAEPGPLTGRHAIVTAGPTHEPIDPVRYIANRSSGKQGFAIAAALARSGAEVTLIAGPSDCETPKGVTRVDVETAREMSRAVDNALPAEIAICVAAVADWRTADEATVKIKKANIKKDGGALAPLALVENPDILAGLAAKGPRRPALVIGFAAETNDVIEHAVAKRVRKGCDWIVANDVSPAGGAMGGDDNTVHLIDDTGVTSLEPMTKHAVADAIVSRIAAHFNG